MFFKPYLNPSIEEECTFFCEFLAALLIVQANPKTQSRILQVMILFIYSCFQLAYLMFFKPYLDRSVQAVEEIVLICETVSFMAALLVLWRTQSGWAATRLSDGTLQSLLLSAQLLSVLVQLVHQWYK